VTETVLSSATKEVVIGFDRPFVVIGERINPTGRKILAEEMKAGNFETVIADAIAQVEAGADMLDVNAGIPLADEPAILRQTIELVQELCHSSARMIEMPEIQLATRRIFLPVEQIIEHLADIEGLLQIFADTSLILQAEKVQGGLVKQHRVTHHLPRNHCAVIRWGPITA